MTQSLAIDAVAWGQRAGACASAAVPFRSGRLAACRGRPLGGLRVAHLWTFGPGVGAVVGGWRSAVSEVCPAGRRRTGGQRRPAGGLCGG